MALIDDLKNIQKRQSAEASTSVGIASNDLLSELKKIQKQQEDYRNQYLLPMYQTRAQAYLDTTNNYFQQVQAAGHKLTGGYGDKSVYSAMPAYDNTGYDYAVKYAQLTGNQELSDWLKTIPENTKQINEWQKVGQDQWAKYATEDDWNNAVAAYKQQQEMLGLDLAATQQEINDLSAILDGLPKNTNTGTPNRQQLISGFMRARYSREAAEAKADQIIAAHKEAADKYNADVATYLKENGLDFTTEAELRQYIQEKTKSHDDAAVMQFLNRLGGYKNNTDFSKYSSFDARNTVEPGKNDRDTALKFVREAVSQDSFGNPYSGHSAANLVVYLNLPQSVRSEIDKIEKEQDFYDETRSYKKFKDLADQLTSDEIQSLTYAYQKGISEDSDLFNQDADLLIDVLKERRKSSELQRQTEWAKANPLWASLETIVQKPFVAVGSGIGAIADWAFGKSQQTKSNLLSGNYIDYDSPLFQNAKIQAVREAVTEDMSDTGKFFANAGFSIADNAILMAAAAAGGLASGVGMTGGVSAAENAILLTMGTEAFTDTLTQAMSAGKNEDQAIAEALLSGAIETVTELIGMDKLVGALTRGAAGTTVKSILKSAFIEQPLAEGLEEVLSGVLGEAADLLVYGDEAELNKYIREQVKSGKSESQALSEYLLNKAGEIGLEGAAGFISGLAFGAFSGSTGLYQYGKLKSTYGTTFTELGEAAGQLKKLGYTEQADQVSELQQDVTAAIDAKMPATAVAPMMQLNAQKAAELIESINDSKLQNTVQQLNQIAHFQQNNKAISNGEVYAINDTPVKQAAPRVQSAQDAASGSGSGITYNGAQTQIERVESVSPRAVKVRLANGETVSASKLTVGDQNLADLIGLIPNNFNAQQATGLLEGYTPEVSAQVAPADYARAYNLAYQAGLQGFRESSVNGINKAIPAITLQTAYVQGTVARQQSDKSTTRQAELNQQDAIEIDVDPEIDSYISNNNGSIIKGLKQYILALLDNEKITMSDGTVVSVDSADAKHIAKRASHSDRQRAEISNLKKLIKKAELYDTANSRKNDKFSFYKYYEAKAKYKGETVFVTLNVGQTKNDGTFRLYDITEPNERNKRNTPSRMNGSTGLSENPESIPLRKGASADIISNRSGIVNPSDLTTRQRSAQEVASKAGFNVVFEDIPENGFFDPKTKTIHISVNDAEPVRTTLIHELAHYAERSNSYWTDFANPILESKSFLNWIKGKGFASVQDYKQYLLNEYAAQGHDLRNVTNSDGSPNNMAAEQEMVAKFTGEVLFANDTTGLQRFLQQMSEQERRGFIGHVRAFFNWLKNRMANFAGRFNEKVAAQNAIRALEKRFTDVLKRVESGETVSETTQSVRYSFGETQDSINRYVENAKNKTNKQDYKKYAVVSEKLLHDVEDDVDLSGYAHALRDNDIRHMLNSHGDNTNEKYPVTLDDIKLIPHIVENYDKVYYKTNDKGQPGIVYVKVFDGGIVYYVEAVTDAYGGEPLLINKQMVKTGINDIPNLFGLKQAITKKQTEREFLSDLWKARKAYARSEYHDQSTDNSIPNPSESVNTQFSESENDTNRYNLTEDETERQKEAARKFANGEITAEELNAVLNPQQSSETLEQIAYLKPEDASTTPQVQPRGTVRGDKTSKFYDSIQEADIFNTTFKEEVKNSDFLKYYEGVEDAAVLEDAKKMLDRKGRQYVSEFFTMKPKDFKPIDVAAGFILMSRYQSIGDYAGMMAVAERLKNAGTQAGQTVQMFSILGRMTPEGMTYYAQKSLDQAYEVLVKGRSDQWIKANKDKFQLTADEIEFIRRRVWQAAQLPDGREKRILLAEITQMLQDKIPPQRGDALRALQRINMLLNAKTNVRNVLGNAIVMPLYIVSDWFGAGVDKALSRKTGYRTTATFQFGKETGKAFVRGAYESYDDFRRKINTRVEEANKYEVNFGNGLRGKSFNENHTGFAAKPLNALSRALNTLDRVTTFLLDAGDRPFYQTWFINSLNGQMRVNNATEPTAHMIDIATQEALQRTWQDDNAYSRGVQQIKGWLNNFSVHGFGLGDIVVKFAKTPANLTKGLVDFSPVGMVKAIAADGKQLRMAIQTGTATPQLQKRFVNNLSKGITGTILTMIFVALAEAGVIRGKNDDDKDVAAFEKNVLGMQPYSVQIGDKTFTYDWAQPIGPLAAMVADVVNGVKKSDNQGVGTAILEALKDGGNILLDQSFMQSIQNILSSDEVLWNLVLSPINDASVLIPQVVSQIASFTDPYARQTYVAKDDIGTALNRVAVKIPWLRETLEKSISVTGEAVENQQYLDPLNAFAAPANVRSSVSNKEGEEIYRIYQATGQQRVIPPLAPNYVKIDGKNTYLTNEQKAEYQIAMSGLAMQALSNAMKSKEYKSMSDDAKADYLANLYSYTKDIAEYLILKIPMSDSNAKMYNAEKSKSKIGNGVLSKAYGSEKIDQIIAAVNATNNSRAQSLASDYISVRSKDFQNRGMSKEEAEKEARSELRAALTREFKAMVQSGELSSREIIAVREALAATGAYGTTEETYKAIAKWAA